MSKIEKIASKYRNIPYKHRGRSLRGLDCLGLLIKFYQEFEINLSNYDMEYQKDWYKRDPEIYIKGLLSLGKKISFADLDALDLVYFTLYKDVVTHAGIMINQHEFIHILQDRNVEVSSFNRFWRKKFSGARRIVAVEKLAELK